MVTNWYQKRHQKVKTEKNLDGGGGYKGRGSKTPGLGKNSQEYGQKISLQEQNFTGMRSFP